MTKRSQQIIDMMRIVPKGSNQSNHDAMLWIKFKYSCENSSQEQTDFKRLEILDFKVLIIKGLLRMSSKILDIAVQSPGSTIYPKLLAMLISSKPELVVVITGRQLDKASRTTRALPSA